MKQKTDEMPDEWVRQTLRDLPDTPPPGSSFDSARLWNQLRPEIEAKPARHRVAWWLVAACLTGLVGGWLVWTLPDEEPKITTTSLARNDTLAGQSVSPKPIERVSEAVPAVAEAHQPKRQRNEVHPQNVAVSRPDNVVAIAKKTDSAPVDYVAELPDTNMTAAIVEKIPASGKANMVVKTPKRRFRVMHENELRADDEAAPKMYRTDHFVRLGTGPQPDEKRSDNVPNRRAGLIMPLQNQSNQ